MQYRSKTVDDIRPGRYGRAVVRVDFNVPLKDDVVVDSYRIEQAWPTIKLLLEKGLKLVLVSHIGEDGSQSLKPVADHLNKLWQTSLATSPEEAENFTKRGDRLVLLENIRRFSGEKENDPALAAKLSGMGEIFVNEAFSVSHREHASVVGIAELLPCYAGLRLASEIDNLSKVFEPEHPFVLILGGKKAETKTPLVEKFLDAADKIIIGGALANDFLKASGVEVGKSLLSEQDLVKKDWLNNPKMILPDFVVVQNEVGSKTVPSNEVAPGDKIVDAGGQFVGRIKELVQGAKLVVWNGSFGICEKGFDAGTKGVAEAVIASGAHSVIGGGDTTAAVESFKLTDKFSFVSTGGGAMLDFLAKGTLPGIEALRCVD